ncbi:MAG: hypothetical protein J6112_09545 [Clostridia bacterium]|nr:hypothetical protein [Clostridia bacterium]
MTKELFKNDFRSYAAVSLLGIAAGLTVAFFSRFPADDFWGLAFFSSGTFGFWFFSSSLIALFSSKNYVAGINVACYVYFMFYLTGIFKRLAIVQKGYNTMQYFLEGLWQELAYGLPYAAICFGLAFALWYGRKNKVIFVILRFLPAGFIFAELVILTIGFISSGRGLFMPLVDALCLAVYLTIMLRTLKKKE